VNINAQDQDRSVIDHLSCFWLDLRIQRSVNLSSLVDPGLLLNDRPLDNQSQPLATDTGQDGSAKANGQ
jgi:hypothetical protein